MNRKILFTVVLLAVAALAAVWWILQEQPRREGSEQAKHTLGIMQHAENAILDDVRNGFLDQLADAGLVDGESISVVYRNAQTSNQTNNLIATQLVSRPVDLIFAIATPTAQAAAAATTTIPIVFGAISDPVSAGLVDSLESPGRNCTGTSDVWPFEEQLRLFKQILPGIQRLGVVHNPGEANSVYNMGLTREAAQTVGLTLVEAPVAGTAEVYRAASSLAGRCDAMYVPSDNTAVTAAASIIQAGRENQIPVFAGDVGTVEAGAISTLGTNYYEIGRESGRMASEILLEGRDPARMPVRLAREADLVINLSAAEYWDIPIPSEILKDAARVIE